MMPEVDSVCMIQEVCPYVSGPAYKEPGGDFVFRKKFTVCLIAVSTSSSSGLYVLPVTGIPSP